MNSLKRWIGPAGPWLNRATAFLVAVWTTHALLRLAFLFRSDPFGFPIVGKADWYVFHALFIDLHWIFLWSLPFLILIALAARLLPAACKPLAGLLALFHAVLLIFTVIDQETLRFMGTHFDPSFARTYGNTASLRPVFHFLASDKSIQGLPYVLLFGSIPCTFLLYRLLARTRWAQSQSWSLKPVLWISIACAAGYVYLYVIWPGGHRMAKLRPFVHSVFFPDHRKNSADLSPDSVAALAAQYQKFWRAGSADTDWTFPRADYPYYREPRAQAGNQRPASRPNFVLFILESHRALNVGHLKPYGAPDSATPFLDSLAHAGHYWTRMITSGLPTINALISIHLSIPQHPTRLISSDFVSLSHHSFTATLAEHGYSTRYFTSADPAWDNETPWLRQWYQGIHYDRALENDGDMLRNMAQWMRDSLSRDKPFFVAAMTKVNHYPFNPVQGVRSLPDTASMTERMNATMAYTDSCLRVFVDSLRNQPWFSNTVFIILGDHGFPLGEHGSSKIGYGLYTENIWLPLVIWGGNSKLGPSVVHNDLASHADLAPTILDLAGIREANSYFGHSLLAPTASENQFSLCFHDEQAVVEHGPVRWHGAWGATPREQGEELFDIVQDRLERRNILDNHRTSADTLKALAQSLARLHLFVVEKNRLWPNGP